ncbi:MAG TPA: hypothetical protein VI997_02450 [Candidatus Thermoplasmatota archaeon]|nr:hypothetical protein [Candidatus Thermoplasmatota archaeon]
MQWLVKARVRPGSEEAIEAALAEGELAEAPFAKELRKALAKRLGTDAHFYFPLEGKDPERELGPDVLEHVEVLGKTKIHEVASGYGFDDEDEEPVHGRARAKPAAHGRPRPAPRRTRASQEDE